MTKTIIVKCDNCGSDLGDSGQMPAHRIVVSSESRPRSGDVTYAVNVYDPLPTPLHFCNLKCLAMNYGA